MIFFSEETESGTGSSRREFLHNTGKTLMAAALTGGLASCNHSSSNTAMDHKTVPSKPSDSKTEKPVKLSSLNSKTEKKVGTEDDFLPPDKKIGYAIVGLGHLALGQILPAFGLCKKSKPVALVSGDKDKAMKVARQYGIAEKNIYNYENYDNIRDNQDVDVIYIVLPNSMHAEFTIRGAKAGKHILCEKPMANSVEECAQMIQACENAGKKLMIAYRIQYEPNNAEVRNMVTEKKYGNIKSIVSTNAQNIGDPSQWRLKKRLSGGGALPDIGLYCINTIRYITGEEPTEVYASTYSTPNDERFKEVEESVSFQMIFPSGIRASCTTSYGHHEARNYSVYAEKGYFGVNNAYAYKGLKLYRGYAEDDKDVVEQLNKEEKDQFALEMDHMSSCILDNKKPYTPGEEGLQDHKIMDAIYESARIHKPVALEKMETQDTFRGAEKEKEKASGA